MHERVPYLYKEQWDAVIGDEMECQHERRNAVTLKIFRVLLFQLDTDENILMLKFFQSTRYTSDCRYGQASGTCTCHWLHMPYLYTTKKKETQSSCLGCRQVEQRQWLCIRQQEAKDILQPSSSS